MRPVREEQSALHVRRFLAVSAVYLGLAEPASGDLDASRDGTGTKLSEEVEGDGCCCRAA